MKFFSGIISPQKWSLIFWGLTITILTLYNLTPGINSFDTHYYFLAGENFWNGTIDCLRTPVYPLLLKLFSVCFGEKGFIVGITILQSIVYLLSVKSLRNVIRIVINNRIIRETVAILYVVCIAPGWCNELLTESLSISGCIIITDLVCRYIAKPSWKLAVGIAILTSALVFLRPTFIFLLAILPLVWIVLWIRKKDRIIHVISLSFSLIITVLFLEYCKTYEKEYGVFSSSMSFACNSIYDLKRSNSWDLEKISNPQSKALISQIDKQWGCNYDALYKSVSSNHKNLQVVATGLKEMKQQSKEAMIRHRMILTAESFDKRFCAAVNTHTTLSATLFFSSLFLSLPLSLFYGLVIVSCVALLLYFIKKIRLPLMASVLILFMTAQCVGVVLFTSDSHERVLSPVYPLFLILLGIAAEKTCQVCHLDNTDSQITN